MSEAISALTELYKNHYQKTPQGFEALAETGSYRQYFRIKHSDYTILGVYNTDLQENKAYLSFTKTFTDARVNVPEIIAVSEDHKAYLIEDLGNTTLYDCVLEDRSTADRLSAKGIDLYSKTLKELLKIQTKTIDKLDLSYCYPRDAFDKQSMLWDLNYFKYFFLRLMRVPVDEQKLEDDIQEFSRKLNRVDQNFFLYRDFQSRNVMIRDEKPYFIDFQGGRKGAIYYDVASLLYDANIELKQEDREILLEDYYLYYNKYFPTEKEYFKKHFYQFALLRLMQALGAFGLRGVVEKKPHFKECIPYALESAQSIVIEQSLLKKYPTLCQSIMDCNTSSYIKQIVRNSII